MMFGGESTEIHETARGPGTEPPVDDEQERKANHRAAPGRVRRNGGEAVRP